MDIKEIPGDDSCVVALDGEITVASAKKLKDTSHLIARILKTHCIIHSVKPPNNTARLADPIDPITLPIQTSESCSV